MTTTAPLSGRIALTIAISVLLFPAALPAQGTRADYERADSLQERTRGKVFREQIRPHWFANGNQFWYRNDGPDGMRAFFVVDATRGTRRPAFDHARLAEALGQKLGTSHKPSRLPIANIAFREEGAVDVLVDGRTWRFLERDGSLAPADALAPDISLPLFNRRRRQGTPSNWSPRGDASFDRKWTAVVKDQNVVLEEKDSGSTTALTKDGSRENGYERGVFWSPDSKHFVALRTERGEDRKVYLIESTPKGQLQPRLQSYDYRKPGDKVPITKPHLFDVASKKKIPIPDGLFANPFAIGDVRWSPDSTRFTFLFNQRGHQAAAHHLGRRRDG